MITILKQGTQKLYAITRARRRRDFIEIINDLMTKRPFYPIVIRGEQQNLIGSSIISSGHALWKYKWQLIVISQRVASIVNNKSMPGWTLEFEWRSLVFHSWFSPKTLKRSGNVDESMVHLFWSNNADILFCRKIRYWIRPIPTNSPSFAGAMSLSAVLTHVTGSDYAILFINIRRLRYRSVHNACVHRTTGWGIVLIGMGTD